MTLRYLLEHAEPALLALELACKEATHLRYTHRTLFAQPIDADWVKQLNARDDLAEKVDAFVSRFGRLQDHLGEKLIPRFAALLGESPKSMLDVLAFAEKMQWIENAEMFIGARKLRNLLVHEHMSDAELFLQALLTAREAAEMLFDAVTAIEAEAVAAGVLKTNQPLDPAQRA
jgi:hypothetical protein